MCFFCPSTPPDKVQSKGSRGQRDQALLDKQNNPHVFAIGLKDACCAEPCCCLGSALGAPCGFTACYMRKAVLDKYHNVSLPPHPSQKKAVAHDVLDRCGPIVMMCSPVALRLAWAQGW